MKILILSASVGSGHMRAAEAVQCALRETRPEVQTKVVDVLDFAAPLFRRMYREGYLGLASAAPRAFGYFYDAFDRPGEAMPLREFARGFLQRRGMKDFVRYIKEEACDAAVNTHFLPAEILADLKARGELRVPQTMVVTDFDAHRFWARRPCEHFFAGSIPGAASLICCGVPAGDITVSGIPVHPVFSCLPYRTEALKSQALPGDRPVVLQMAGGDGLGAMEEIWKSLLSVERPLDLIAVAGRNAKARERIERVPVPARHRARVLGYTDKVQELMAASDLLVSKPGGLSVSEALSCGLPFAAIMTIPGQEKRNADFLLDHGAGIRIESPADLAGQVSALLEDPRRLRAMRQNALKLARPRAAFEVAEKAVELARAAQAAAAALA